MFDLQVASAMYHLAMSRKTFEVEVAWATKNWLRLVLRTVNLA
jgi:hypothetical protein